MRIQLHLLIQTLALCKVTLAAINANLVSNQLLPPCCDARLEPGPETCPTKHICCPDGSWGCGLLDNPDQYLCSNEVLTQPTSGIICQNEITSTPTRALTKVDCCVAEAKPDCEKAACCEDGTWTCPSSDGTYLCNGQVTFDTPRGKVCDACCINSERPPCPVGDWACCSDGTLVCPEPTSGLYTCWDVRVKQPLGRICCCDPTTKPLCIGGRGATCCADGSWACPVSPTGAVQCPGEFGFETAKVCPCCDPALEPGPNICDEGYMCCPDGSWGCSIVCEPGFYKCSGIVVTQPPVGIICPKSLKPTTRRIANYVTMTFKVDLTYQFM